MLFEKETLNAQGKAAVLAELFKEAAEKKAEVKSAGYVPIEVLEAHGDLTAHVCFLLDAAAHTKTTKEEHKQLRKVEKLLDSLPESILYTLPAGAGDNWLHLYRKLVQLHSLLEDTFINPDEEEYTAVVQKIVQLAVAVANAARVQINPASMFTLLLMQVHLHKYAPQKRKRVSKSAKSKVKPARKKPRRQTGES